MEERFRAQKREVEVAFDKYAAEKEADLVEIRRRLVDLNHAHEQAREKDREFINREVYDKQMERIGDDVKSLSNEVKTAAEPVAAALVDQDKRNSERFSKIENTLSKMVGALVLASFAIPILTGFVTYLVTRK
jgi:ABC-type xylose transport system substrate-binding protein